MNTISKMFAGFTLLSGGALSIAGCASDAETNAPENPDPLSSAEGPSSGDPTARTDGPSFEVNAEQAPASLVQGVAVPGERCDDAKLGTNCQAYLPDIVKDPHGGPDDLLMVYRWSSAHMKKPSQLRMVRSRDGGATWQRATPFIVANYENLDYRDPCLTATRSGRLVLSYFVSDGTTGSLIQTQVKYRDADDAPFSSPVQVFSSTLPRPVASAKTIELSNGQMLIPLYGTPSGGGNQQSAIVASVDGGKTWDGRLPGRQKTIAASDQAYYQEPAIAEIEPGHVRAVIRVASGTGQTSAGAEQYDSYDGQYMATWKKEVSLGVAMHGPELFRIPGTNLIPYLWSQPNAATGPTNRPTLVSVRHTDVLWPSTPKHVLYNPGTTWDSGYPSTAALDGQHLVTALYDASRRALVVLRYNVSDVD